MRTSSSDSALRSRVRRFPNTRDPATINRENGVRANRNTFSARAHQGASLSAWRNANCLGTISPKKSKRRVYNGTDTTSA